MSKVSLSNSGLALILLEGQIRSNVEEILRWKRRKEESEEQLNICIARLERNTELLNSIKT